ncbi:MAG: hypothetical protein LBH66_09065 [Oscillospiraceae bacterium]|jgi:uncharacterized protein YgiM (DUF1202 family)|nr:hypothetical protein [Oscillospiraceae bacterium]
MEHRLSANRSLKITAAALAVILAAAFSSGAASAQSAFSLPIGSYVQTGEVSNPRASDHLNLRALPSVSAASMAQYRTGERVEVWGTLGDWSLVRVPRDNRTGYMMTAFLKMDTSAPAEPTQPVKPYVEEGFVSTSNGGRLNLRETPSLASRSLGLYYNGVSVKILAYLSEVWAQVAIGDGEAVQYGYMQRQFIYTYSESNRGKPAYNAYMAPSFIRPIDDWPLYDQPSDTARIISRRRAIDPVEVLGVGAGRNGRWWHVRFPGDSASPAQTGFIPEDDDNLLNYMVMAVNAPGPSYALNLRAYPGYDGAITGKVYNGVSVTVLNVDAPNDWRYVCVGTPGRGTVYGYMRNDLLVLDKTQTRDRRPVKTLRNGLSVPMLSGPNAAEQSLALYKADGRALAVIGVYGDYTQVYDEQTGLTGFFETRYLK